MVGDNQSVIEGPLEKECIHGKLIAVERNGRTFSVNNIIYRFISYVWLLLRPVRMPVAKSAAAVKRCIKKMVKRNEKNNSLIKTIGGNCYCGCNFLSCCIVCDYRCQRRG